MLKAQELIPTKKDKSTINSGNLDDFLSDKIDLEVAAKVFKISQREVMRGFFRVNVWTKDTGDETVVHSYSIVDSFYLEVSSCGEIIDRTIRKEQSNVC